jgi:hypothetical protein
MDDNVTVRIVGDASRVKPAVEQTEASVSGLTGVMANLNAFIESTTAKFAELMGAGTAAGEGIATGMRAATAATVAEGSALTGMILKVHEGAEAVRTFQMRAKAFAEVYVGLFAVEQVAHWAESLGEAAEKTEQLSAKLGMTVPQVQGLSGAAQMSGTNIDVLSKALGMMDNKALQSTASTSSVTKAFHAVGHRRQRWRHQHGADAQGRRQVSRHGGRPDESRARHAAVRPLRPGSHSVPQSGLGGDRAADGENQGARRRQ